MQDLDLNINLFSFQEQDNVLNALQCLIDNEYDRLSAMNENKSVDIQYNQNNKTLRIIHHNWIINRTNFMVTSSTNTYSVDSLIGVINLTLKDCQLNFMSKDGTFTPIIKHQTKSNNSVPCLFLQ